MKGCLSILGLIIGLWIVVSVVGAISSAFRGSFASSDNSANDSPAVVDAGPYRRKASSSVSRASIMVGNFPTGQDTDDYALGLKHIGNLHEHVGNFTIFQVLQEGRAIREQQEAAKAVLANRQRAAAAAAYQAQHAHDGCNGAVYYSGRATDEFNANNYKSSYDDSIAGLARVSDCSDDDQPSVRGRLLGDKALSEHHLSSGNSADDLNQAITLLSECQSRPGYYGESSGAHCETEEEILIRYKTDWEMNE